MSDVGAGLDHIERCGVIAVLRHVPIETLDPIGRSIVDGGVTVLEVTADRPDAVAAMRNMSGMYADHDVLVGAGTVTDVSTAHRMMQAGADFIVTPTLDVAVVRAVDRAGVPIIPGILTPTEASRARQAGADAVKLFPATSVGPGHLAAMLGPMPQLRIIPTGGISLENGAGFIEAGAIALGVGSALVGDEVIENGRWETVSDRAAAFVELVDRHR